MTMVERKMLVLAATQATRGWNRAGLTMQSNDRKYEHQGKHKHDDRINLEARRFISVEPCKNQTC